MRLDLETMAYSGFGSFFTVARSRRPEDGAKGLYLRTMHGNADPKNVFELMLLGADGPVPFREEATPASVTLRDDAGSGAAQLCFESPNVIRLRGIGGAGIRLYRRKPDGPGYHADYPFTNGEGRIQVNAFRSRKQFMISVLEGSSRVDAPWDEVTCPVITLDFLPDEASGAVELAIESFEASWTPRAYDTPFESVVAASAASFRRWLERTPPKDAGLPEVRELAAYAQYASVVEPHGLLRRRTMLISPAFNGVWSWDHCFNAMALSYLQPETAWDQLLVPFDLQDETGAIPDFYNDREVVWNYVKPPIHGWTLRLMLERTNDITDEMLRSFYPSLVRWTNWWFQYRDSDGNGIPQYHHGNDSGWDNSTIFREAGAVEGADLSAFLVVQMDALALAAERIGLPEEAAAWRARADAFFQKMMAHFWDGEMFVARRCDTGEAVVTDSLLHWIPVVLGERLPADVVRRAAEALRPDGPFVTAWGPATEKPSSPDYRPDGYWRGPIWAPSTFLLIDGLHRAGEVELSREIARRFCRLVEKGGMAENFNALTGEGLRDRFHTWPASVFLLIAQDYL